MTTSASHLRPAWTVSVGVGLAQTIAWGTLFYAIAALGASMAAAASVDPPIVYAAFTVSLLLAGLVAPWAGRTVDRRGGRVVLIASGVIGAAGMAVLAVATSGPGLFAGWCLNGVAMALGLYDIAFAAVYRTRRGDARRVLTGVTLLAGLASTVFWPLSDYLLRHVGLRTTLGTYAVLLLATIPLYQWALPDRHAGAPASRPPAGRPASAAERRTVLLLSAVFATTGLASGALSAHLLGTLRVLDVPAGQIPWIASFVGVMQVAGRVLEISVGARLSPLTTGMVSLATLSASFVVLLLTGAAPGLAWVFAIAYGMSNGVLTIARATVPAALLGSEQIGALLGRLARPSVVTRALAPWMFAAVTELAGPTIALTVLLVASAAGVLIYVSLLPARAATEERPRHRAAL